MKSRIEAGLYGDYEGLSNGLTRINDYIFGLQRSSYTLIGGLSGSAKTTFLDYIILNAIQDAEAKGKAVIAGTFLYPVLMAADILMYDATHVPVGIDNKQHLEITRDIARKFNKEYGVEYFQEPKEYLIKDMQLVPGIDGRKMSKSYGNHIPLFSTREEIEKLVKKIVTDSGSAALAAVTALATTVASLRTLIVTLTNLVLKIQKKVKA